MERFATLAGLTALDLTLAEIDRVERSKIERVLRHAPSLRIT